MLVRSSLFLLVLSFSPLLAAQECVVLLHGLLRTSGSMEKLADELAREGFRTVNVDYPSNDYPVQALAPLAVEEGLAGCRELQAAPVHFVTHSLGGIVLRQYAEQHEMPDRGRVVMLGPPNQGSEVVDRLKDVPGFDLLAGPAGRQLGTHPNDLPARLGAVDFELGVIAGSSALNPLFSLMVPNPDDGSVSVESTEVEGMCAHLVLPVTHFLMMRSDEVIMQTAHFLRHGRFDHEHARNGLCAD